MMTMFAQSTALMVIFVSGGLFRQGDANSMFFAIVLASVSTAVLAIIHTRVLDGLHTSFTSKQGDLVVGHLMNALAKEHEERGNEVWDSPMFVSGGAGIKAVGTMYLCQLNGKRSLLIEGADDK